MAIMYVGAGTASASASGNVTPTLPAGLQANDLMVAIVTVRGNAAITTPSGWTEVFQGQLYPTDNLHRLGIFRRFYQSGDTDPTFVIGAQTNATRIGQIFAFRGVDQTNPIPDLGPDSGNASAQNIGPITGFTPTINDGCVIVIGHKADDWTSVAVLTGDGLTWVEIGEPDSTLGNDAGQVYDYAIYSGSPPTISAKTFTVTGGAANTGAGKMFSIKPTTVTTTERTLSQNAHIKAVGQTQILGQNATIKASGQTQALGQNAAVKASGQTQTINQDAYIKLPPTTQTIDQNAMIKASGQTQSLPQNGTLKTTESKTLPQNATIKSTEIKTIPQNGWIILPGQIQTISQAAFLKAAGQIQTIPQNATLKTSEIKLLLQNARLKDTFIKTIAQDAWIKLAVVTTTQTIDQNARLKTTETKQLSENAVLKAFGQIQTIEENANVKSIETKTIAQNATLKTTFSRTIEENARLKSTETKTISQDAFLIQRTAQAIQQNAWIKAVWMPPSEKRMRIHVWPVTHIHTPKVM